MTRNKTNLLCARAYKNRPTKERDFHSKFRAGDENWVYGYDPGTKQQSSQWKSHHPAIQESWGRWSQTSRMCCLFSWVVRQFFRRRFFLQCHPVNQQFLHRSTKGFYGSCWEKMPDKWCTQDWLLHHDNMPSHTESWLFSVPNQEQDGGGIWPLYFSILVFMAYSGSQR